MDTLPLPVIGWIFTVASAVALLLGTWLTIGMYAKGGAVRQALAERMLEDLLLYSIWLLGLAGGVGVLAGKPWSRPVLELFCWTLMILLGISASRRFYVAPRPRSMLGLSFALYADAKATASRVHRDSYNTVTNQSSTSGIEASLNPDKDFNESLGQLLFGQTDNSAPNMAINVTGGQEMR